MKILRNLAIVVLMVTGCAGPYAVKHAAVSDWVWGVEERENGYTVIWFRYDNYGAYCTNDETLIKTAQTLREQNQLATYEFKSINAGDVDGQFLGSGCPAESIDHETFRLLTIRRACDVPMAPENEERCRAELAKYNLGR